ncbi:MAG: hypothetical protein DWQ05_11225 [Calditrichaeota bacterium]|nr:MAG: hypothetical protein DWQ05_11225 [Calditrichota bacterium]
MINKIQLFQKHFHLVFISILLLSCQATQKTSTTQAALFNHWVHSHEEDSEGLSYYRLHNYAFPRSRGRLGFEISKDGEFVLYAIAAADGQNRQVGTWHYAGSDSVVAQFPLTNTPQFSFKILSCENGLLKIRH